MKFFGLNNNLEIVDNKVIKKNIKYFDGYFNLNDQLTILKFIKTINVDFLLSPIDAKIESKKLISSYKLIKNCKTFTELKLNLKLLSNVAFIINELHKVKVNDNLYKWDYVLMLKKFKSHIKTWVDKNLANDFSEIEKIAKYFNNKEKLVFSHNDLVPGNFLITDKKITLIDYDYSCVNYYLFDFASFISETIVGNQEMKKEFINICINNSYFTSEDLDDLKKMLLYQDYLWMLWSNALYNICRKSVFLEICENKIEMYKKRKNQYEY